MNGNTSELAGTPHLQHAALQVHVVAHQDDWMLFGGEYALQRLAQPEQPLLIIHTTAGDAGEANGWWEARELATVLALRQQLGGAALTISRPRLRGHSLQRYGCGAAVLYFLRCADGGKRGKGHRLQRRRSLTRLQAEGKALPAVDGSTRYSNWDDLCDTLAAIIRRERRHCRPQAPAEATWILGGDPCSKHNPGDHADHQATALAAQRVARAAGYGCGWFLTYCSRNQPANLPGTISGTKERLFRDYGQELGRLMGSASGINAEEWRWWGERSYSRWITPADHRIGGAPDERPNGGAASTESDQGRAGLFVHLAGDPPG